MNTEKLIAVVKEYKCLYDHSHKKYNDNEKKNEAWKEIGVRLKTKGKECKKSWALLRDAFRRAVKRKKKGTSGLEKKWKYEEEMSFLLPYIRERNIPKVTSLLDSDQEDVDSELSHSSAIQEPSSIIVKKKNTDDTDLLIKYIIDKHNAQLDDIDQFFAGITTTVKSFPLQERAIVKAKIFDIVSNIEIDILHRANSSQTEDSELLALSLLRTRKTETFN